MRYRFLIVIVFVVFVNIFSVASSNNGCYTCGSIQRDLKNYIDMVSDIVLGAEPLTQEAAFMRQYRGQGGLFGGGLLRISPDIVDDIERSRNALIDQFSRNVQTISALTYIGFSNIWDVSRNNLMGFAILFQNYPILRDRVRLQDLNSIIQDSIFELGIEGKFSNSLSNDDYYRITEIFEDNIYLFKSLGLSNNLTYAELMENLQNINRALERFLIGGEVEHLKGRSFGSELFYLSFNDEVLDRMQGDYVCSRGIGANGHSCPGATSKFIDDMNNITDINKSLAGDTMKEFRDATIRLKTAITAFGNQTKSFFDKSDKPVLLSDEEKELLSLEQELLRTVYGSDYKRIRNRKAFSEVGDFANDIVESVRAIRNNFVNPVKRGIDGIKSYMNTLSNKNSSEGSNQVSSFQVFGLNDTLKDSLSYAMIQSHGSSQRNMSIGYYVDPKPVLVYFPMLFKQLETIRDLIGDRNSNGMIINNLGMACELQCNNKGGVCWW